MEPARSEKALGRFFHTGTGGREVWEKLLSTARRKRGPGRVRPPWFHIVSAVPSISPLMSALLWYPDSLRCRESFSQETVHFSYTKVSLLPPLAERMEDRAKANNKTGGSEWLRGSGCRMGKEVNSEDCSDESPAGPGNPHRRNGSEH